MSMYLVKKLALVFICAAYLHGSETPVESALKEVRYVFCMDGGGSKTELVVLNAKGEREPLQNAQNLESKNLLVGVASNLSTATKEELTECLSNFFDQLKVGNDHIPFDLIRTQSAFVGGFAGGARPERTNILKAIVENLGFKNENIAIDSDAALALELVKGNGGILIGGTGSICFFKNRDQVIRVGGLGYRIGDEGSGYDIGLKGIRAAIEQDYEYGARTSIRDRLLETFDIETPRKFIATINHNQESPATIASVARIVFEEAWKGDAVACNIISDAAESLAQLASKAIEQTNLKNPTIYLIGGLFKNEQADRFIKMMIESAPLKNLNHEQRPLLINMAHTMATEHVVRASLCRKENEQYQILNSLPIVQNIIDPQFQQKFNTSLITTEQSNEDSSLISTLFHQDPMLVLRKLHALDQSVVNGAKSFIGCHLDNFEKTLFSTLIKGGRIIFIGSGSSGRIAVDLAAKWKQYALKQNTVLSQYQDSVIGVIAGGPRAFVRSQEGFEDSQESGYLALQNLNFKSHDVAVLISASGSAQFNIGAAQYAYDQGGHSFYFYNNKQPPERTAELFSKKKAFPLFVEIGAQSITGSTRLQAASLAELCLGLTLNQIAQKLSTSNGTCSSPMGFLSSLEEAYQKVLENLPDVHSIINLELATFLDPKANFRKTFDESDVGYVSFIACSDSLREVMIDTTETSPTFSTNPPRYTYEVGKKKSEFRAYLQGKDENIEAWQQLLGRHLTSSESLEVEPLLVSALGGEGYGSFELRTNAPENLVLGVFKTSTPKNKIAELLSELSDCQSKGVHVGIIALEIKDHPLDPSVLQWFDRLDAKLVIKGLSSDTLGIIPTLALKQILNLISNSSMFGMNKVFGNMMIDISPSNNKLIDRTIRMVQTLYAQHHPEKPLLSYDFLHEFVRRVYQYKKLMESQYNRYTPSSVKLILTMLTQQCAVEEALEILAQNNEAVFQKM